MKLQWNKLCESLASYGDLISKTLEYLPSTKQSAKIKKHLAKEWELVIKTIGELDKMIDPSNPPEIKYPFDSERFKAMWMYYKNYLTNNHQFTLTPWNENSRLTMLSRFAKKDEERAMQILELLCANNYRNIVCPTEKQLTGEEDISPEKQTMNLSMSTIPEEI